MQKFGYDKLYRLTNYQKSNEFEAFSYDGNANRLSLISDNNTTYGYKAGTNQLSKIEKIDQNSIKTTTNFLYDENGNLLKDASHDYIYDKKARLVGVDNNVSYAYNHENTRVSKTVNAQTTHFIYDGAKLIGEYNSDGSVKNEYIYLDGTPLAVISRHSVLDTESNKLYYIHTDHLGTPRRLADENGNIVWSWESKAFGDDEAVGIVEFNLRFAGQYFDNETKTHYNINRDYNPKTGRYIESDPIGFDGGVNSYGYVAGNPLGSVDEMGLYADVIFEREKQVLSIQNNGKKRLYVHAFTGGHWDGKMVTRTIPNHNPIPKGDYFITENVRPEHTGSSTWLSLLKKDDRIDDYTYEGENKRYGFRFHRGTESHGCVTLPDQKQFNDARTLIVSGTTTTVKYIAGPYLWSPIRNIKGYGKLTVK